MVASPQKDASSSCVFSGIMLALCFVLQIQSGQHQCWPVAPLVPAFSTTMKITHLLLNWKLWDYQYLSTIIDWLLIIIISIFLKIIWIIRGTSLATTNLYTARIPASFHNNWLADNLDNSRYNTSSLLAHRNVYCASNHNKIWYIFY